ncbi:hypothetical protein HDU76_011598 [Blyttiomyces sp. JEL0837]|nr:hypothetical protein HDU76_011598 [Blyttiomyces sp. JEL0837]
MEGGASSCEETRPSKESAQQLDKRKIGADSSPSNNAKLRFERLVRRYYYQLTVGCNDKSCTHKLCASCASAPKLAPQAAAITAVQLASRSRHFFCPRIPLEPDIALSDVPVKIPSRSGTPISSPRLVRKNLETAITAGEDTSSDASSSRSGPVDGSLADGSPVVQPASSRPFLFSLLSSSPFSSLFRSTEDYQSPDLSALKAKDLATMGRSKSAMPVMGSDEEIVGNDRANVVSTQPVSAPINISVPNNGGLNDLRTLGRSGSDATAAMKIKAKSWMDLPSLLSASIGIQGRSEASTSSTPMRAPSPPGPEILVLNGGDSDFKTKGKQILTDAESHFGGLGEPIEEDSSLNFGLERLTLPLLVKAVEAYQSSPQSSRVPGDQGKREALFIVNTIRTVFSNSDALNQSFLLENFDCDSHELGLDLTSIREAFNIVLGLEPRELFERTLVNALEILLATLILNMKKLQTGSGRLLRQFITLLEVPLIRDRRYHENLLKKLCIIISGLRSRSKMVLIKWLSSYDSHHFTNLLKPLHSYISDHYYPGAKADEAIIAAVRVLSLLYHANDTAKPARIVPISLFYNETLNRKLNFKEEYRSWKKTLDGPKIVEFSYFNYPFLFDPVAKTRILHIDAMVQMSQEFEDAVVHQAIVIHAQRFLQDSPFVANLEQELKGVTNPFLVLEVRRQHLVKDVLDQIRKKEKDMKKPLKVKFIGGGEEGMDQGGVQKEFFQVIVNMLLDPAYGMFTYDEDTRYCWINGASLESEKKFELVGTVLGLALYNGVILGINFPKLLYKKLVDEDLDLEDIKLAFPALGKGLQQLLDWNDGDVYDIFMRNFEIAYDVYGQVRTFPLVENGENIPVTNLNRKEYVALYIQHYAEESVRRQFSAFRKGFHRVCGGKALKMCRAEELELLLCGTTDLDFGDLERGAQYDDGYSPEHSLIRDFWDIVHNMTFDQKKKLLMFVTASDRVPLKGLGNLTFVIQRNGPDTERLPTALTCFGRLLLPEYSSKSKLKERLMTAIENAQGFGLV